MDGDRPGAAAGILPGMPRANLQGARRPAARTLAVLAWLAAAAALWAATVGSATAQAPAPAADADEIALAEAYAPIVKLRDWPDACAPEDGPPYLPIDVDLLFGNDEIALRGPWDRTNLVGVAPEAEDLGRGLFDYHLDFPGDTLDPGCTFEEWAARIQPLAPPTAYARVVTEDAHPGRLALQYWFYYVFNDWNNKHEGDWEMIQIVFDADTPAEALATGPTEVGYSQHSSAEQADWGDDKLEIVDGTHPVVYPAQGSQANFFESRLYLMRSQAEGVGCDDTRGPSTTVRPRIRTIPSDPADHLRAYPWLGFDGRWGEKQRSFFNGPTGPNEKLQWTQPITWSEQDWRDKSFDVPASGALGTSATDIFCGSVAIGSETLRQVKVHPGWSLLVIGVLAALLLWGLSRTVWEPVAPLRVARRRAWGQSLAAAARLMARHPRTFLGIGLLFIPLGILITALQYLLFRVTFFDALVDEAGVRNSFVSTLALGLGLLFTFLGFCLMQAATAWAVVEIDAGRVPRATAAYRAVLRPRRLRPLALAIAIAIVVQVVLDLTIVFIPVAVFLVVWWSLIAVSVGVEGRPARGALRRSGALVRGHWWRTAAAVAVAVAGLLIGPAIGVVALLLTGAAFDLVNMIAAMVYVAALPFAAIVLTYLYFDLRVRLEEEEEGAPVTGLEELPQELRGPFAPAEPPAAGA